MLTTGPEPGTDEILPLYPRVRPLETRKELDIGDGAPVYARLASPTQGPRGRGEGNGKQRSGRSQPASLTRLHQEDEAPSTSRFAFEPASRDARSAHSAKSQGATTAPSRTFSTISGEGLT
jgi:type IV secretory pathway VirB10-like protein